MYVETEAKMDSFQDKDGNNRTALNLLQRKLRVVAMLPELCETDGPQATSRLYRDQESKVSKKRAVRSPALILPTSLSVALALLEWLPFHDCIQLVSYHAQLITGARSSDLGWKQLLDSCMMYRRCISAQMNMQGVGWTVFR